MSKFKVGDEVEIIKNDRYIHTTGGQRGKILQIDYQTLRTNRPVYCIFCPIWDEIANESWDNWSIEEKYIKLAGLPLSKEERVINKIKYLDKTWKEKMKRKGYIYV